MDKLDQPEINTSALTAEVRKAMARQVHKSHAPPTNLAEIGDTSLPGPEDISTRAQPLSADMNFGALKSQLSSFPKSPKLEVAPVFEPNTDDLYHLNDLLKFNDADFLNAAYRAILKREPDSFGYNYYLEQLREGHLDKVNVLASLRFSSEGELKNVRIKGLALPTFIRRLSHLPVIGYPIRLGIDLLRLPVLIHRLRQQEARLLAQNRKVAEHADQLAEHVDSVRAAMSGDLSNLSTAITDLLNRSHVEANQQRQLTQQLESLFDQQGSLVKRHETLAEQHETLAERQETVAEQQSILAEKHETLAEQQGTLAEKHETVAEQQRTLAEKHDNLVEQQGNLAEDQHRVIGEMREELRADIDAERAERAGAQEQTHHLIQAQQALLESATNDTRAKIAELESSARDWIAQLESSANANTSQLESSARAWIAQLESSIRAEIAALGSATNEIRTRISESEPSIDNLRARIDTVESSASDLRSTAEELESSTNTTQAETVRVYQQLQHVRSELALQGRRMALILEEARSRLPGPFDQQQLEVIATEGQHKLDALYAELEDNFRGSHEEIKERFRTYLPHIKSLDITDDLPIADLGCGRGEWLELLKEEGHRAIGIDTNSVMLDRCRARGLEVIESDGLRYLRGLPDNCLSAITGFHIIEHLEIEVLVKLLEEIVRTLSPGGVVIFETPNPENVLVGSNYFYLDPTHRNPLPSLLMKFLFESRGLHRIEVTNLHAWDQARIGGKNQLTARFNELFYGPMDYAIAGWKVSE